MLKELDALEKAVGRLVERAAKGAPEGSRLKGAERPVDRPAAGIKPGQPAGINEEAAELIRRALKRLRSL